MIPNKIKLLIELISEAYSKFNSELFKGELPDSVISIEYINNPNKNSYKVYGAMCINGMFVDSHRNCAESIVISPVAIASGFEDVMITLLHEMVHIYNKMCNIEDASKKGKHNKNFKESAEMFGLTVEKDELTGWTTKYLSSEHYFIVSDIKYDKDIFDLDYEITEVDKSKNDKPKKSKFKHSCPNSHFKPFKLSEAQANLKCSICGELLVIEEEKPKDK